MSSNITKKKMYGLPSPFGFWPQDGEKGFPADTYTCPPLAQYQGRILMLRTEIDNFEGQEGLDGA